MAAQPDRFLFPRQSDLRFNWVCVRFETIDHDELRELVVSAWRMCVPKKVADAYDASLGRRRRGRRSVARGDRKVAR